LFEDDEDSRELLRYIVESLSPSAKGLSVPFAVGQETARFVSQQRAERPIKRR
jgi:hypothetical protein